MKKSGFLRQTVSRLSRESDRGNLVSGSINGGGFALNMMAKFKIWNWSITTNMKV